MVWLHLPIRDVSTPGPEFEAKWPEISRQLRSRLDAGENVVVHCRGGLGRAGMISARLLVESGVEPEAAIGSGSRCTARCDRDVAARGMGQERFAAS